MKLRYPLIVLFTVMSFSCAKNVERPKVTDTTEYFKDMKGCFLLYNLKTNTFEKVIGESNCKERFPAFSTFKIPLAVMAFDSGALADENVVLKWDGVKEARIEANHDHDAKTWMRDSIVWFSQRLTPIMGKEKFQQYLNDFDYGNKDVSEGIKTAWLVNPGLKDKGLRISAYEQVEFMKKLWIGTLPVSKRSMEITREITFLEVSPMGFKLNGKTGSNFYDKEHKYQAGWFISHLQKDDQEYITVANINDLKPYNGKDYGGARAKQITKLILTAQGLW